MKLVALGCFSVLATWFVFIASTGLAKFSPNPETFARSAINQQYPLVMSGSAQPTNQFVVFDSTWHKGKPDLSQFGLRPITLIGGQLWEKGADRAHLPDKNKVLALAEQAMASGGVAVLDIEHWPVRGDPAVVADSLAKYSTVLEWFHGTFPGLQVGYYGVPPIRDYWRALKGPGSKEYLAWQAENDGLRSLAHDVDVLFPSLYTFYPHREGWVQYATAQIREARRYGQGRPVYVFLWPAYHDSSRLLANKNIEPDFWKLQLETARTHADGIVIWGGGGSSWDEQAPWWKTTKEFMAALAASRLSPSLGTQ